MSERKFKNQEAWWASEKQYKPEVNHFVRIYVEDGEEPSVWLADGEGDYMDMAEFLESYNLVCPIPAPIELVNQAEELKTLRAGIDAARQIVYDCGRKESCGVHWDAFESAIAARKANP